MPEQKDSKTLIGEALKESEYETEESFDEQSWNDFENAEAPKPPVEGEQDASKGEPVVKGEAASEAAKGTEEEPPEDYWGTDLRDIPADKRSEIIAKLEQQDSTIQKLQAKIAEAVKSTTPDPEKAVEPEAEVTDADILRAMGTPEDEIEFADPRLVVLGRTIMDLETKVEDLSSGEQGRQAETYWNKTLDELEANYGKLPYEREDILRYALAENIGSPFEVYFQVQAPVKSQVEKLAAEARRDGLKKEAAGGLRPRGGDSKAPTITSKMTMKDAVTVAAKEAEKETGFRFRDAVKKRLVITQE